MVKAIPAHPQPDAPVSQGVYVHIKGIVSEPIPRPHLEQLGELCLWLYGSKADHKAPLIRSQNPDLRKLDETIGNKNGVAAPRSGLPLDTALNASRGDERLLREALVLAEQKLKEARGLVLTGFKGQDAELLSKAKAISTIAESVSEEMEQIAANHEDGTPSKKRKDDSS